MGTNGIVFRAHPEQAGMYQFLRFRFDGYLAHQGPILVEHYATDQDRDRLFAACGDGVVLEPYPYKLDIDVEDAMYTHQGIPDMSRVDGGKMAGVVHDHRLVDEPHEAFDITHSVVCFFHDGAWHAVPSVDAWQAIETGDTSYRLTDAKLSAWFPKLTIDAHQPSEDSPGAAPAHAPFGPTDPDPRGHRTDPGTHLAWNEHQGVLRQESDGTLLLEVPPDATGRSHRWELFWQNGCVEAALTRLVGHEVTISTGTVVAEYLVGESDTGGTSDTIRAEVRMVSPA